MFRCNIQPDQRLACAGHAGHKTDRLFALCTGGFDDLRNRCRGQGQVVASFVLCDLHHRMAAIERQSRFNYRRGRFVPALLPLQTIQRRPLRGCQTQFEGLGNSFLVGFQWLEQPASGNACLFRDIRVMCFSGDQ